MCVCVLVFRSSVKLGVTMWPKTPLLLSARTGRVEFLHVAQLFDLTEVRLVALIIFAASSSFSPIIDLIKHDYQHYRESPLCFFVSV